MIKHWIVTTEYDKHCEYNTNYKEYDEAVFVDIDDALAWAKAALKKGCVSVFICSQMLPEFRLAEF